MAETSGSNNPRAQRGNHASQPVGKSNNPRHSQPVGAPAPRHSQPVGARPSQPMGGVVSGMPAPASVMAEPNPYSRSAAGGDYAQDRRRKKRKRVLLGALAAVLVVALGGLFISCDYINQVETNFNDDIKPEIQ